jgi:hypothetical protein
MDFKMNYWVFWTAFWSYPGFWIGVFIVTWTHIIIGCFKDKKVNKETTEKNLGSG